MVYKGIVKTRDAKRKAMLLVCAALVLYMAIKGGNYLYIVLDALLVPAVFFKKEHVVSEEGVAIVYDLFGMKVTDQWTWDQITVIRPDFKKSPKPDIFLEIAKDVTIRGFVFTREDAWGVMALGKKMNPNMWVDDRTEEQHREDADERNRKLAEAREREARAKKAAQAKARAKVKAKKKR